jgi:hypothetical protein
MTDATGTPQIPASTVSADLRVPSPDKTRRRLILAAGAALPSVFTLSSGAQTAGGSNVACLARQEAPPARFISQEDYVRWPDGWVRAPVAFGDYDGAPADCVTTPQNSCAAFTPIGSGGASGATKSGDPSPPGTDAADGSVWIVQGERVVSSRNVPIRNIKLGRKHYGLVYVDQSGTVSTLDPNGSFKLSAVKTSCWASITGGAVSKLG